MLAPMMEREPLAFQWSPSNEVTERESKQMESESPTAVQGKEVLLC